MRTNVRSFSVRVREFGLSWRGLTRSLEDLRKEARKCVLLCSNLPRGGGGRDGFDRKDAVADPSIL